MGRDLGIGAFSVLTGLSIPTIRSYDDVGLLRPTSVHPTSGDRRYVLEQVHAARFIRALRAVDAPIEMIREIVDVADQDEARRMLMAHRDHLARRTHDLSEMVDTLTDYIENGVHVAQTVGCRVVEVNIGVDDLDQAQHFYEAVFGVDLTEERHGDGPLHLFAAFGSWPSDEFFLLNISKAERDPYRSGRANFGFLVDDLEAVHQRAIVAGGTEIVAPQDVSGMPRTSSVVDPSGNLIHLYQNV